MATAWAIVNEAQDIITGCIRRNRTDAIKALVGVEDGWQARWRRMRKWGAYVTRVEVTLP